MSSAFRRDRPDSGFAATLVGISVAGALLALSLLRFGIGAGTRLVDSLESVRARTRAAAALETALARPCGTHRRATERASALVAYASQPLSQSVRAEPLSGAAATARVTVDGVVAVATVRYVDGPRCFRLYRGTSGRER